MKQFFTYILLVALTLQSFYRSIMVMDYEIHLPDYIENCINKDKPQLHCNGQCVLMKRIQEQEKENSQKNFLVYEYSSLYVHKDYPVFEMQQAPEEVILEHCSPYIIHYGFNFKSPIFHPPLA